MGSRFSTFGFLNPFVQSKWKERATKFEEESRKRSKAKRTPQDTPKQDGGKAPDMGSHESERKRDRRYTRQHGGKDNG